MMHNERKVYGGYLIRKDPEVYRMIDTTNKNLAKAGFVLGLFTVGAYALYKKVDNLSKEVKKMKEEMGK